MLVLQDQEAVALRLGRLGRMGRQQKMAESWLQAYCQPLRWPIAMNWCIWG